jgi:hypothetical protein
MTAPKSETQAGVEIDDGHTPWQFSLRTLLIVVTIVSILLAIGVHFGGFIVALATVGLMQAAMLFSADWLIRPEHRRVLAFVTAASWALVGSAFVIMGFATAHKVEVRSSGSILSWSFVISLFGAGALAYYIAHHRWQQLSVRRLHVTKIGC